MLLTSKHGIISLHPSFYLMKLLPASMHSVVGRLATLLFDLALWLTTTGVVVCRRKHASLSRCGRVTAKHQVVSSKDATARARYLRFLNSSALLVLHEVVLSR